MPNIKLMQKNILSLRIFILIAMLIILLATNVTAKNIYVDIHRAPSTDENGSQKNPWSTLKKAMSKNILESGDTLILSGGNYGTLTIKNRKNKSPVTITSVEGEKAEFSSILINSSQNWILQNLKINGSLAKDYKKTKLVLIDKKSSSISLTNLNIQSIPDASQWSQKDWHEKASDGIRSSGRNVSISNNQLTNVGNGITVMGEKSVVKNNVIEQFSADGMRGLANNLLFEGNTVKNCIKVDQNHDDGFQSWSSGPNGRTGRGTISNVVLRGNTFIGSDNPNAKFTCAMQGIGLFDGMYENWIIENNLVVVDHWHGITVMGAKNVRIIHNTVIDPNDRKPGPASIKIFNHKKGMASSGSVIANNIAASFGKKIPGVFRHSNLQISNKTEIFQDPENFNFNLKENSPARKKANMLFKTQSDIKGRPRPKSERSDVGAFQYSPVQ
ncbi:hypothetical protein [Sneathiella sp.]|jgi:hypothetical protein|uniref:hypothetical protein n=1 Tax=Sneathiella sp. TaxID=1964365 RepID=UPI0039E2CA2B